MLTYLRLCCARYSLVSLAVRAVLILALAGPGLLAVASAPVEAASPSGPALSTPNDSGQSGQSGTDPVRALILKLSGDLVALLVFLGGVVLTISIVKGLLDAQVNSLAGSPMGVSHAQLNLIGAIVTGILTLMSPLIIVAVFNALAGVTTSADITVPAPTVLLH